MCYHTTDIGLIWRKIMARWITILQVLILNVLTLSVLFGVTRSDQCERLSACSCECPDGIIDIEPLSNKNGQPKYKDLQGQDQQMYSYNPCNGFTETNPVAIETHCENVAACQVILQSGVYQFYDIGTQSSAAFETRLATDVGIQEDGEVVVVMYTAADGARQTEVALVCNDADDTTNIAAIGELPQSSPPTYRLVIVSPDACYIPIGLSPGTIMIIVFVSGVAAYLLLGVLYKKFISKASGRDLLPNADLWFSFPGLVKEGFCFVVRRKSTYKPV